MQALPYVTLASGEPSLSGWYRRAILRNLCHISKEEKVGVGMGMRCRGWEKGGKTGAWGQGRGGQGNGRRGSGEIVRGFG